MSWLTDLFMLPGSFGNFSFGDNSSVKSFADELPGGQFLHSVWNDFTGATAQRNLAEDERKWQEYFYNQYQSPSAMVQQYREAGLNPNMLNGAGQQNPPSASTPSVNGDSLSSLVGAAKGVGELFQNQETISQNRQRLENDIDISQFGKRLTEAQTYAAWMKGGYDSNLAMGAAISNYWANDQNIADLAIKRQNRANMEQQWSLIQSNKAYVDKQLEWYDEQIKAEIDLNNKRALLAEKQKFESEERTRQMKLENDFFEGWNYHSDSPIDVSLRNRWQAGDFDGYDSMLDFALDFGYKMSFNQGLGNAISSRFGKMSIWEIPAEMVHRVDELLKDSGIYKKLDEKSQAAVDGLQSDLNYLGNLLKQVFDFVQEDNIYNGAGSDGNKPLYAQ